MSRSFPENVCRILMIGNSFCMNYIDELYGMAKAVGVECRVTSVVAGACTLVQHWTWHESGEKRYQVFIRDAAGSRSLHDMGLDDCLALDEWDVISYQDGEYYYRLDGFESAKAHTEPYLGNLVAYVRGRFPAADHYFHQVWAYQVGYYRPEKSPFRVETQEAQAVMHRDLRALTLEACERHSLLRMPSGDAWLYARADSRVGDNLCLRDCEHESDLGGGRYLNACVWFETLFGESCVGNPYRPPYALDETRVTALQEAAHRAVREARGTP